MQPFPDTKGKRNQTKKKQTSAYGKNVRKVVMQLFSSNNLFCLYLMYPNYTNFLTALSYTACPRPRGGWNIGLPNVSGAGLLLYCCRCNSATADLTPIDNSGVMVGRSPSNAEIACLLWLIWFACGGGYLLLLLLFFLMVVVLMFFCAFQQCCSSMGFFFQIHMT